MQPNFPLHVRSNTLARRPAQPAAFLHRRDAAPHRQLPARLEPERWLACFPLLPAGERADLRLGLALGAAMKFPRWAYPYPVFLAFAIYLLAGYANSRFNWAFDGQNSFFIALAVILVVLWLPGLRAFYRNIPPGLDPAFLRAVRAGLLSPRLDRL